MDIAPPQGARVPAAAHHAEPAGPQPGSQRRLEFIALVYAMLLIVLSTFMFMLSNTSEKLGELVTAQNDAALKLWINLDYYAHHHNYEKSDTSLPPGLFASLVEFSRGNANILRSVHRLRQSLRPFSPTASAETIVSHLAPKDGKQPPLQTLPYFDHIGVDPQADSRNIVEQGMYQIELYQAIRDYAQEESSLYKDNLEAVSVYALPVLYALLGALLWALRLPSRPASHRGRQISSDWRTRFAMAAIAGVAISTLGSLLPTGKLFPPVAIAFVFGYSIDIFIVRLDLFIDSLTKPRAP